MDRISDLERELGITDTLAVESSRIQVHTDSRRYGKMVTVVEGFDAALDLDPIAKDMKKSLGTGGTVKGRTVELQGDHRKAIKAWLAERGYQVS